MYIEYTANSRNPVRDLAGLNGAKSNAKSSSRPSTGRGRGGSENQQTVLSEAPNGGGNCFLLPPLAFQIEERFHCTPATFPAIDMLKCVPDSFRIVGWSNT